MQVCGTSTPYCRRRLLLHLIFLFCFAWDDWRMMIWLFLGDGKAVWARAPGLGCFSPHAPRAWVPLPLSTIPSLSLSTPSSVEQCTLFYGGRTGLEEQGKARQAGFSLTAFRCVLQCSAPPWGEGSISDQVHILQSHHAQPGLSHQFAVQPHSKRVLCVCAKRWVSCQLHVSRCVCFWLPSCVPPACCPGLPAFSLDASLFATHVNLASFTLHTTRCHAGKPVLHQQTKMLTQGFLLWASWWLDRRMCLRTFLSSTH
jgi:hypothetical protein